MDSGIGASVKQSDFCGTCRGETRVKERKEATIDIPAGIDKGEKLRVAGRGHAGPDKNSRSGDLYVIVDVLPPTPNEAMFKRNGSDVTVEVLL